MFTTLFQPLETGVSFKLQVNVDVITQEINELLIMIISIKSNY